MGTHYQGTKKEKLALNAYIKLMRAAESVGSRVSQHLQDSQLTVSQFGILESLYHLGPLCQKDLGEKLLKTSGNITMVVNNLEKKGLVQRKRQGNDRRMINVHLTEKGIGLIEDVWPAHLDNILSEMSCLTKREQESLGDICRKLGKK